MVTGTFRPAGARHDGQHAIADAPDAQDAKMARFFEADSEVSTSTSLGWSKTFPGCSGALRSKTLSSNAVIGRMVSFILRRTPLPRVARRAAVLL